MGVTCYLSYSIYRLPWILGYMTRFHQRFFQVHKYLNRSTWCFQQFLLHNMPWGVRHVCFTTQRLLELDDAVWHLSIDTRLRFRQNAYSNVCPLILLKSCDSYLKANEFLTKLCSVPPALRNGEVNNVDTVYYLPTCLPQMHTSNRP